MQTGRVRANGVEFAYRKWGDGDRLALCCHGFPDDAGTFAGLAARLTTAGFTVVAPYMRGYGPTGPAPDGDYSAGALGRDAVALADVLSDSVDTDDTVVVGHDWGAVAAYTGAAIDPGQFSHMVAMALPPRFPRAARSHPRQWLRSWYMGFFQLPELPETALRAGEFALIDVLWGLWSPGWNYSTKRIEAVKETFREGETVAAALEYYRQFARDLLARNPFSRREGGDSGSGGGGGIAVPGLVMAGKHDGCIGPGLFADADDAFDADCRVIAVGGAGHFVHCERPDAVADEIVGFVGR